MKYWESIQDPQLRNAVRRALAENRWKLFYMPSSLTALHHPKDEHGVNGLSNHIEKVALICNHFAEGMGYTVEERDILMASAYFHDLGKVKQFRVWQEVEYENYKAKKRSTHVSRDVTNKDIHPLLSSELAQRYMLREGVPSRIVDTISAIILCHMNHWYPYYPRPKTDLEKMFSMADYLAAREELKLQESLKTRIKKVLHIGRRGR
jgi:response regulator RpfG family c-di-GMP phosphodiesterase